METKVDPGFARNLIHEIRTIYESDSSRAEVLIEAYLEQKLKPFPPSERLGMLEKAMKQFGPPSPVTREEDPVQQTEFLRLFSLLLGKRVSIEDLSSTEPLRKLAHSLNTIFDSLNQIVGRIQTTLLGRKTELETIRQIIGSDMTGEGEENSLQGYLDQIQNSFLVAHRSFQHAIQTRMKQILTELDPDRMEAERGGGLKFGPLRKAELFEIYKEKFRKLKGYFESGRFMEELLREFEKNCQKLYNADLRHPKGKENQDV
jgi:hypothetical protein